MKNKNLVVSETFYSLQGEGQTMGFPAVFLRLAGCNLLCSSPSWICDTIEVWKKGISTLFKDVLKEDYITRLRLGAHLVITGGEPLLHQDGIISFLAFIKKEYGFFPIVEIETNGTIIPDTILLDLVDYWNCSPKLSNSGETIKRRLNVKALQRITLANNSIFKFVISEEKDVDELFETYGKLIDFDKIVLMPSGETQIKLNETRKLVAEKCIAEGLKFSDRLHINIWNEKTGV